MLVFIVLISYTEPALWKVVVRGYCSSALLQAQLDVLYQSLVFVRIHSSAQITYEVSGVV